MFKKQTVVKSGRKQGVNGYLLFSRVGSSVSVKDFKLSWRSGEAFLAILCSLRPQLVDLSLVRSRSNRENLEEAFHLAEKELQIPRLLEPQGEADGISRGVFNRRHEK